MGKKRLILIKFNTILALLQKINGGLVNSYLTAVMTAYQFFLYAQGDITRGRKATLVAVCVAVGFSLLSEIGQGMERDHVRMETKSLASPTYQAIIGQLGTTASSTTGHPYSTRLADAKMKLARCRQKVSDGIWRDCIESTARLTAVQALIDQHYEQLQAQSLALAHAAKAMEKDESNYHPLVNLIRETINASGSLASFILSLVLISFFEYAFHYLGRQYAAAKAVLLAQGYDVTRKTRKPPRAIRPDNPPHPSPAPDNQDKSTWNHKLAESRIDSPTDPALNQSTDKTQIKRLIERGRAAASAVPEQPEATVYTAPEQSEQPTTAPSAYADDEPLYQAWKKAVKAEAIGTTARGCKQIIETDRGVKISMRESYPVWRSWGAKGLKENFLTLNPDHTATNRKPKYLLSEQYPDEVSGGTHEETLRLI